MRILTSVTQAFEGVGIALDALRANKVRAALTIMGVALGVFVVVAMSSVVQRHQRVVPPRPRGGGPDVVLHLSPADRRLQRCDRRSGPRDAIPAITIDEVRMLERAADHPRGDGARRHGRGGFKYEDKYIPRAGMEVYTPNWTDVDGGDIYPGRSFTYAENAKRRAGRARERQARRAAVRRVRADGQGHQDRRRRVPGDRPLSLHGQPDGHADVGRSGRFAQGDHPVSRPRERHLNLWMRGNDLIVKPRAGVTTQEAVDDVTAALRGYRAAATEPAEQLRDRHAGPPLVDLQRSCSARSSSSGSRSRRSGCWSAASA